MIFQSQLLFNFMQKRNELNWRIGKYLSVFGNKVLFFVFARKWTERREWDWESTTMLDLNLGCQSAAH